MTISNFHACANIDAIHSIIFGKDLFKSHLLQCKQLNAFTLAARTIARTIVVQQFCGSDFHVCHPNSTSLGRFFYSNLITRVLSLWHCYNFCSLYYIFSCMNVCSARVVVIFDMDSINAQLRFPLSKYIYMITISTSSHTHTLICV